MGREEMAQLTAKDMRNHLLSERAVWVIKYKLARACGDTVKQESVDEFYLKEIWDAIVPMIHRLNDIEEIKADTASDVLSLLAKGKVTIDEALKLMALMQEKQNIEELPALIAALASSDE